MAFNPFAGMSEAKDFERGEYLPANFTGTGEIKRIIYKKSRKGKDLFTVEFEIVTSNLPEVPVGSARTWQQDVNQDGSSTALYQFCCALEGIDRKAEPEAAQEIKDGDAWKSLCQDALCPVTHKDWNGQGSYNGKKFRISTYGKETKVGQAKAEIARAEARARGLDPNAVKVDLFTVHDFGPYTEV